ncbi:hypothetical protein ACWKWC_11190 [Geodermatophilus nigrescens]
MSPGRPAGQEDVAGAVPTLRVPDDGPVSQGLRIGDSDLGIVADDGVAPGSPGRVLVSIEVDDVDAASPASRSCAARRPARPTTCPGGSGWPTSVTPTATR